MSVNRIANLLKEVAAAEGTAGIGPGFTVNPFAQANPMWMQIYQAAFLQAQKAAEEAKNDDWPTAEWWE